MVKKTTFTLVLVAILLSCKKHRLKDEKAILEGKWEWSFSIKTTNYSFSTSTDTIFSSDVSSSYGVTFLKKGKVQLYENNELKDEYRTVFTKFESGTNCLIKDDPYKFEIDLDNDWDNFMNGCVNADTLVLTLYQYFPFQNVLSSSSTVSYIDFFKKVE